MEIRVKLVNIIELFFMLLILRKYDFGEFLNGRGCKIINYFDYINECVILE